MRKINLTLIALFITLFVQSQTLFIPDEIGTSLNTGRIGIGTNYPQAGLHLRTTSVEQFNLCLQSTSSWGTLIRFITDPNDDVYSAYIGAKRVDESGGQAHLVFGTNGNFPATNGFWSEKMRITTSGEVGIGTTAPLASLHIKSTKNYAMCLQNEHSTDGDFSLIIFIMSSNPEVNSAYIGTKRIAGGAGRADLVFGTNEELDPTQPWKERMRITSTGEVGIGTNDPNYTLDVAGTIRAEEILVCLEGGCDYVFDDSYNLPKIEEVEKFIKQNKHLPEIAAADEMIKNNLSVAEFNMQLLKKIEELTLYIIEQNKEIKDLKTKVGKLSN